MMAAPAAGGPVLEELDGTPIRPDTAPPQGGWRRAMLTATIVTGARPVLWAYALVAFLARGGILVLVVPMVTLPTLVELANAVGPTSVTAAGPTAELVAAIGAGVAAVAAAVIAGTLIAAAAEVALHRATIAADPDDPDEVRARPPLPARALRRSIRRTALAAAAVRFILLVPVLLALLVATPAWVSVAYAELVLPTDLAIPFPVRVLLGALGPSVLVLAAWLVGEALGGLATRRIALVGTSAPRALLAGLGDLVRAPLASLATLALGLAGSVVVLAPGVAVVAVAWDRARIALVDNLGAVPIFLGAVVVVTALGAALTVAGVAAAWRAALWTAWLEGRHRLG